MVFDGDGVVEEEAGAGVLYEAYGVGVQFVVGQAVVGFQEGEFVESTPDVVGGAAMQH